MINRPTGMDNKVNNDLSLFFTIEIIPITNPATPITARNGVGRGSLINMAKPNNLIDIDTMKSRVKVTAYFPAVFLGQS